MEANLGWDSLAAGPARRCIEKTNWTGLCAYASRINGGMPCHVLAGAKAGLNNVVRVLEFDDNTRWVARVPVAAVTSKVATMLQSEADTMALVRERTSVPVPSVFACESDGENSANTPFILMEYLPGCTAMDADGGYSTHHGKISADRKPKLYSAVASIQARPLFTWAAAQMTSLRFSKIGTVVKVSSGEYDIAPFPDLGGPFDTATDFFKAWAANAHFPGLDQKIATMGSSPWRAVMLQSIREFPSRIAASASSLIVHDKGPFPLAHTDFLHSNFIVDSDFNVQGVIDWEGACTLPWELIEPPSFVSVMPREFDLPDNYDANGLPIDPDTRAAWEDRDEYVRLVAEAEHGDTLLSATLSSERMRDLAYVLNVYTDPGKLGLYSRVLDKLR